MSRPAPLEALLLLVVTAGLLGCERPEIQPTQAPYIGTSSDDLVFDFVAVSSVAPGSPADTAGIMNGDIVLSIAGERIANHEQFASIVRRQKVGDRVEVVVLRQRSIPSPDSRGAISAEAIRESSDELHLSLVVGARN